MNSKLILAISVLIIFFTISSVSASENSTDLEVIGDDNYQDGVLQDTDDLNAGDSNASKLYTHIEETSFQGEVGDVTYVPVEIFDENDEPVMNGTATLLVGGVNYTTDVRNGTASFNEVSIEDGLETAMVYYNGNEYYNPSQLEIDVFVIKETYMDIPIYDTFDLSNPDIEKKQPETVVKASNRVNATGNPILVLLSSLILVALSSGFSRKN